MPENTHLFENTNCYYWIDKNTDPTSPNINTGATFNVNDPTFWPPESVLSGIASGLCERIAVAKVVSAGGTVAQGTTVSLSDNAVWTLGATTGITGNLTNSQVVSKLEKGIANGINIAYMFGGGGDPFATVGSSAGNNYMRTVDSAIDSLIHIPDGYVNAATGAAYVDFGALAEAARATANALQTEHPESSIALPTQNGGAYNKEFKIAYPVGWAKERKWMLDQLRYTGGGGTTVVIEPKEILGVKYAFSNSVAVVDSNVDPYYSAYVAGEASAGGMIKWSYENGSSGTIPIASVFMRADENDMVYASADTSVGRWTSSAWSSDGVNADVMVRPAAGLYATRQTLTAAQNGAVVVTFSQVPPTPFTGGASAVPSAGVSDVTINAAAVGEVFVVNSGGTMRINGMSTNETDGIAELIVSSGGCAIVADNVRFRNLCILKGGTYTGPLMFAQLYDKGFYAEDVNAYNSDAQIVSTTGVVADATSKSYVVKNGGSLLISAGGSAARVCVEPGGKVTIGSKTISNGSAQATVTGEEAKCSYLILDSGASCYIGPDTRDLYNIVAVNGSTIDAYVLNDVITSSAYIDSGVKLNVIYLTSSTAPSTPGRKFAEIAHFYFGANGFQDMRVGSNTTTYPAITRTAYRPGGAGVNNAIANTTYLNVFNDLSLHKSGTGDYIVEGANTCTAVYAANVGSAMIIEADATAALKDLPEPPLSGSPLLCSAGYYVRYRCAVESVSPGTASIGGIEDHYKDFRVRQFEQ